VDNQELIKFWKSLASGFSSKIFLKDSSTLQYRAVFHTLAHISGKADRIFTEILSPLINEVPNKSNPDPESGSRLRNPDRICLDGDGGLSFI